ncbi:copper homeostasis protein (lipoprotein) [Pedobacter sp. UYEF25]
MKTNTRIFLGLVLAVFLISSCHQEPKEKAATIKAHLVKGLYSFGPDMKSFTMCEDGREYWVIDSVKSLELSYSKLNFEKPYESVYVELEGFFEKSKAPLVSVDFDSTLVVTKVIKISEKIPDGPCKQ